MSTETHTHSVQGSLFGAILMIAGCCIGAGMLGLPVLTALAGFVPTVVLFFLAWLFMVTTGLLWLEVNLWFRRDVSIVTMAEETLGRIGKWVSWGTFGYLFYSLMLAYVAASGELFVDFLQATLGLNLPVWFGSFAFVLLFGLLIYLGTRAVDHFNRLLMIGMAIAYLLLIILGARYVESAHLRHSNWNAALYVVPPMVISFGYHNLIPSLTAYLGHDRRRLVLSILIGSFVPLVIYIVWEWLILGLVPAEAFQQTLQEGLTATHALKTAVGSIHILTAAEFFAFFAIVTSFLTVALSFVDFLADGLKAYSISHSKLALCALALLPPFALAFLYPGLFLTALNYSGAFGAVILFGILPALMVWKGRYRSAQKHIHVVPGGRLTLVAVIAFSLLVAMMQLLHELGLTGGR